MIRLNKYLAQQGIASRRAIDRMIEERFISINGKIVRELGVKIDPQKDEIFVQGKPIRITEHLVYVMLNKPAGVVASAKKTDTEPHIVLDLVKVPERIFPVGRLDKETTGLLLLTNDGDLTFALTHPSRESEKEYEVLVDKTVMPEMVHKLESGVRLDGVKTNPTRVTLLGQKQFRIVLTEGKNRQIRRVCQKVGLNVFRLKRIRVKNLQLGDLKEGKWRYLTAEEIDHLKK